MDNNTFRKYIKKKLADCKADLSSGKLSNEEKAAAEEAYKWLEGADGICRFKSGEVVRRFRKSYERNLMKRGPQFLAKYEQEGAALK